MNDAPDSMPEARYAAPVLAAVTDPTAPIERVLRPFREFAHLEAAGGLVLLAATSVALVWANSPWFGAYDALWRTPATVGVGALVLTMDLHHWINDGLMALFFFVVGLEIKRELLVGQLASLRRAALPIVAAVGGMALPAVLYAAFNARGPGASGWGIPMATDIAFALGVLALLGRRAPLALKVFLTALAVVDDLGAVLVIALFYTPSVAWPALGWAAACFAAAVAANRLGVRRPLPYALIGVALWVAVLASGVHATVAGVLLATAIPAQYRINARGFLARGRAYLDEFEEASLQSPTAPNSEHQQAALQALEAACEQAETPLQRLERALHPWVAFAVMPVFALANAGVFLGSGLGAAVSNPVSIGVVAGLVIGKQVGIMAAAWLAVRLGIAALPAGVTWRHVYGAGWLAGIGFTMSLFVSDLAFDEEELLQVAKVAILGASVVSGIGGWLLLRAGLPAPLVVDGEWQEGENGTD